jgi:hypothetical protein
MKQIATALVKAQRAFGPALKTSTNPHFRSRYADLSACVEAVIDALNENGIFLLQKNYESDNGIKCETVFVHESGEMMECGIVHFPAVKQDPQGYASALTYARRYSLMSACGIAAANPLDAIKPQAPAATLPYELTIPGKESRQYETSENYTNSYIKLRNKVEDAPLATRAKMTKLREIKEANEAQVNKLNPEHKAQLLGDYELRRKRLGAQLGEKEDDDGGLE